MQHTKSDAHEEYEKLGSAVKELMKPENLILPFDSTEENVQYVLSKE